MSLEEEQKEECVSTFSLTDFKRRILLRFYPWSHILLEFLVSIALKTKGCFAFQEWKVKFHFRGIALRRFDVISVVPLELFGEFSFFSIHT